MTLARLDVSDFDDTELGAEVRAAFAAGRSIITLFDGSLPDTRANTWVDGTHGLYRMVCAQEHYWLSALQGPVSVTGKAPKAMDCPNCGLPGEWAD